MSAGDTMIDGILQDAATATKEPSEEKGICGSHDSIRKAVYALVLDAQDRRKSASFDMGPVHLTGWSASLLGCGYLIAKAKGWL